MLLHDLDDLTGSAGVDLLERASVLHHGEPLVLQTVAPIDADDPRIEIAAELLRRVPTVTVLVGEPASTPVALRSASDLCLTDRPEPPRPWVRATTDPIHDAVAAHPLAAVALVTLLRRTDVSRVLEAIDAEAATYALLLGSDDHHRWLRRRGPAQPRETTGSPVRITRDDSVLHIALDRPESRNAVDTVLRDALVDALTLPLHDPGIATVHLTGVGPDFSAGGDLREFGAVDDPATALAVRLTRHPGRSAHLVAARLHAHLHGNCIGAGIEIPAFAHTVTADPDTRIMLPELDLGLIPGAGGTVSVRRRIGRHRTTWLALTGTPIDAGTARAWGLVDGIVTRSRSSYTGSERPCPSTPPPSSTASIPPSS